MDADLVRSSGGGDGFEQATLSSGDPRAIALLQLYGVNSADWPDYPVQTVKQELTLDFDAAGGFRDFTRIAARRSVW